MNADQEKSQCPQCKANFRVRPELVGRSVACPKCSTKFVVNPIGAAAAAARPRPSAPTRTSVQGKACVRCQQTVPIALYVAHCNQHLVQDGLNGTFPGLDDDEQFKGDITNEPRFYRHQKCGQVTGMAEKIVRTYLANPWFYGYKSFCLGCQAQAPNDECQWLETGENVQDYIRRLQAGHPRAAEFKAAIVRTTLMVAVVLALVSGIFLAIVGYMIGGWKLALIVLGLAMVLETPTLYFILLRVRGGI